jgi:hypothetical protein
MPMKKPDATLPPSPASTPSSFPMTLPDPSIRGDTFDQQLQNRGVRFIHKRSAPCPNMRSLDDDSHDPNCPHCDNSKILYYRQQEIVGVFYGNSLERLFEYQGVWEIGTAVITLPTEYADGSGQADFNTFDQLVMPDFEARTWELKEYEPRVGGKQRLRYPIISIDYISTVQNGTLKVFEAGEDYNIVDGEIEWVAGKEPNYNNVTERGDVLTISYYINPVYTVLQSMRELRITQEFQEDGTKQARRLPQQVLVKRDFLVNPAEKLAGVE